MFFIPSPNEAIVFTDFCVDCEKETKHEFFFEEYHYVLAMVYGSYHCMECFERDAEECYRFPTQMSAEEWKGFTESDNYLREN